MDVLHRLAERRSPHPGAVAFGNFDGVHLGHREMLATLREAARSVGGKSVVITFDPHPLFVLDPPRAPPALDTLKGRMNLFEQAGVDTVIVLRFDEQLRDRTARWFAAEVLCKGGSAKVIVAGYDCRFGRGGDGDIHLLREVAGRHGAQVELFDAVVSEGDVVSSTRIRRLVARGEVAAAGRLLARPFALRGEVVHGDALGRKIGFPTANIDANAQIRPGSGVYAAWLIVGEDRHAAVCNAGVRPTVSAGQQWRLEAHCLGIDKDLYGAQVSLQLIAKIREERRFADVSQLKAQIGRDCTTARSMLSG